MVGRFERPDTIEGIVQIENWYCHGRSHIQRNDREFGERIRWAARLQDPWLALIELLTVMMSWRSLPDGPISDIRGKQLRTALLPTFDRLVEQLPSNQRKS